MCTRFRNFQKLLKRNGFELIRIRGSHYIYKKAGDELTINLKLNKMVAQRLVKTYNLV